jgi:lactoylglutathione lyase/methylmalonyl-CoA/ethylmalonyl-CoA epimerase
LKIGKIDHIGIVVKDMATGLATYQKHFGFTVDPDKGGDIPAMGFKNAFMPVGETNLEFLQPTSEEGPIAQQARDRGEGTYHLSLAVDDVNAAVEHLRSLGIRVGDATGGIAYVSRGASSGVVLQLIQRP